MDAAVARARAEGLAVATVCARARAMVPTLRQLARHAGGQRGSPDWTIDELKSSWLFDIRRDHGSVAELMVAAVHIGLPVVS